MKITLWRSWFLPRSAVLRSEWRKPEAKTRLNCEFVCGLEQKKKKKSDEGWENDPAGQRNQEAKGSVIAVDLQTGCEWMTS